MRSRPPKKRKACHPARSPRRGRKRAIRSPDPALRLLGLAARAGAVVPGSDRVREAARGGGLEYALVAADLTETGRAKLVPPLDMAGVPYVVRYSRMELGAAVGRAPLAAVGVREGAGFAERLRALLSEAAAPTED